MLPRATRGNLRGRTRGLPPMPPGRTFSAEAHDRPPSPAATRPMSRIRLAAAIALAPVLAAARPAVTHAQRQPIVPPGMSASPTLTPGIRVGDIVYASGQLGTRRENPDTTIQGQTRIALENTRAVFEAAGTTMDQAIKCTVFLVDVKDFAGMNQAYREFFPANPPARSTVVVAALVVPNAKVEIECLAAMPRR
jgi:2-iminobutanoate/2-iminopropanoate deaminase